MGTETGFQYRLQNLVSNAKFLSHNAQEQPIEEDDEDEVF